MHVPTKMHIRKITLDDGNSIRNQIINSNIQAKWSVFNFLVIQAGEKYEGTQSKTKIRPLFNVVLVILRLLFYT